MQFQSLYRVLETLANTKSQREASNILNNLRASPAIRTLVETAVTLGTSPDPQQRNHAYKFMSSAIQEIENQGLLRNYNSHLGNDGSYQSSYNKQPYKNPAYESPDGSYGMTRMKRVVNQSDGYKMINQMKSKLNNHYKEVIAPLKKLLNETQNSSNQQTREIHHISKDVNEMKREVNRNNYTHPSYVKDGMQSIQESVTAITAPVPKHKLYAHEIARSEIIAHDYALSSNKSNY